MFVNNGVRRLSRSWQWIATVSFLIGFSGCSGSGGGADPAQTVESSPNGSAAVCDPSNSATTAECGTLLLGITDAEGDLVSYTVDVVSVSLQRADGTTVEALPATTRVDLAELTSLSELVSTTTLPPGEFIGGSIRIDYTDAAVFVESADEIVPAKIIGKDGAPLGIVDISVRLADSDYLFIRRGQVAFLSIDIDLAISHAVDTSTVPPTVAAEPLVIAEIAPLVEKEIRVRGRLLSVDIEQGSYQIALLPWQHRDAPRGPVSVQTTAATSYEIGDAMYVGSAGLRALAELEPGTLTVAFTALNLSNRTLTASIVHARESVGGNDIDAIHGNIVARNGNRLTVKGALVLHRSDPAHFRRTVLVEIGPDTKVFKIADTNEALTAGALSIGQRIVAFGELSHVPDATSSVDDAIVLPLLDATQGRVRMDVTRLHGTVLDAMAGQLNLSLRGIDRLGIGLFDFTGTGTSPGTDADPKNYEVAVGTLSVDLDQIDRPIQILGFASPFAAAPADFRGRAILLHGDLRSTLSVGWTGSGSTAPFSSIGHDGIIVDSSNPNIAERHHLVVGREVIDISTLPSPPTIVPRDGRALYAIYRAGHVELFGNFGEFVDELLARLNRSETIKSLVARGLYDEDSHTVTAHDVIVLTRSEE